MVRFTFDEVNQSVAYYGVDDADQTTKKLRLYIPDNKRECTIDTRCPLVLFLFHRFSNVAGGISDPNAFVPPGNCTASEMFIS